MKPIASLVIVHWNTPELLKNQLSQLIKSKRLQIIVIDNYSTKPIDWLHKEFPRVTLLRNKENRGYAQACNQGAKLAKTDWVLFLNPDVQLNADQVSKMLNYCMKHNIDAASPQSSSHGYEKAIPSIRSLLLEFTPLGRIFKQKKSEQKTLFGGCLLIRSSVFNKLTGWDEDFFFWFEDSDLTYRLYQNKFSVGWIPIMVEHIGGASVKKISDRKQRKLFFTSMKIYAKKHFSFFGRFIVWLIAQRYTMF